MKMVVYTQNKRYNKIFFLLLFPVFCVTTSDLLFSIFFFSFTQVIENLCYPKNPGTSGMPISFFQWYCRILLDRYSSIESLASHIFFSLHFAYFAQYSLPLRSIVGGLLQILRLSRISSLFFSLTLLIFDPLLRTNPYNEQILTKCSLVIELCTIHKIPFNKIPQTILSNCKGLSYPCSYSRWP